MEIIPFRTEHIPEAAALFIQNFQQLRQRLPMLPDRMENIDLVTQQINYLTESGVAALEDGRLIGYLGWFLVDHFRETERKGAYCPEWGHGALEGRKLPIYRALYRAASAQWAGCQVHAITLLAHDHEAEKTWFWNGFGLTVVDAIRDMTPPDNARAHGFSVRKATLDDADLLAELDTEHWQHYAQPPVFMVPQKPNDAAAIIDFLSNPAHTLWLAMQGSDPMGFIRFEGRSFGAADVVNAETTTAITGAYTRPAYRGRRAAVAILDAALRDYAAQGYERCSVDFESFNPEAAAFWLKYFEPACLSLTRVPESVGLPS